MKKITVIMLKIIFISFVFCLQTHLLASAGKPEQSQEACAKEIDELTKQLSQKMDALPANATHEDWAILEKLNDELYSKTLRCKNLKHQDRTQIYACHKELLQAIHQGRSFMGKQQQAQQIAAGQFSVANVQLPLRFRYRTLAEELALVRTLYTAPQKKPFALQCNHYGWTEPLVGFAQKDNQPLLTAISERTQQHNANNLHTRLAQANGTFSGTLRCFVFRTPFEPNQRRLVAAASSLVPFTSLHYLHAADHAPLLVASVVAEKEEYERFEKENPLIHNSDVHVFAEGQAAAFLEYVSEVATENNKLKTKRITSDLAQFYSDHDQQQQIKANISQALFDQIPVPPLHALISAYVTDGFPKPVVTAEPAAALAGRAKIAVTK